MNNIYDLVVATTLEKLVLKVNDKLYEGYELVGGVACGTFIEIGTYGAKIEKTHYMQAVIKK